MAASAVVFFSKKLIPAETRYETHDQKLLVIVKTFSSWQHYLKDCKYEVLIFTNHNNFCYFMNTKSLGIYPNIQVINKLFL